MNLGRHIYLSLAVGGLLLFFPVLNLVGSAMVTIFLLLPSFAYPNLLSQVNVKSMKRKLSLSSWLGLAGGALLASTVLVYGYLLRLSPFNPGSLLRIETLTRLSVILSIFVLRSSCRILWEWFTPHDDLQRWLKLEFKQHWVASQGHGYNRDHLSPAC